MDVVNEPVIATGAAAAGLMNSKLRISVDGCCWEHGHELRVGGLGTATAEGLEHGPSPSGGLVLKLEVLAAVRGLTAARATLVHPSVERNIGASSQVDNRGSPVG